MNTNLKFEIVLAYYKRPQIVLNALQSISTQLYQNWHLTFIDDSGDNQYEGILGKCGIDMNKVAYVASFDSEAQKRVQGGSRHGFFINEAVRQSDADVIIILCDDDALSPHYLAQLDTFYSKYAEVPWAYSKVSYYNPEVESYMQSCDEFSLSVATSSVIDLNSNTEPINPDCKCDASQVSFRRKCFTEGGIWFPFPQTKNLDSAIFQAMYSRWGDCYPTNFYGQCKGVFKDQLGSRHAEFNIQIL